MNLETKITIYKFTPQLFTLTQKRLPLPGRRFKIQMSVQPLMTAQGKSVILYF